MQHPKPWERSPKTTKNSGFEQIPEFHQVTSVCARGVVGDFLWYKKIIKICIDMHQSLFLYPIKGYTQGAKTVCKISKFENPLTHLVGFATGALQEWDERESPPRFSKMQPKLFKSITKQCISIEYATILPFEQKKCDQNVFLVTILLPQR